MQIKGINYDVGTAFRPGEISRPLWTTSDVVRDMRTIHRELHCTSVNLYGTDLARLEEGAALALDEGLDVWLQLRSIDVNRSETVRCVERAAQVAERLRARGAVTLNVGCEVSLFTHGFLPGRTFLTRIKHLVWSWILLPLVNRRLNEHLARVLRTVREHFRGPVTYSAGVWEQVDWSGFDLVGVNLYRDRWNEKTYVADVRKLRTLGKPAVVTELGCCTFEGAERQGGGGWMIVDFDRPTPAIKRGYQRNERVQADLIGELLDLYAEEGLHGAFVYDFMAAAFPYDPDPAGDLDRASYGVVRVLPGEPGATSMRWERKEAFEAVALRYASPSRMTDLS